MKKTIGLLASLCLFGLALFAQETKMTQEEYIETYKDIAIREMKTYAIPASITLAQGILESANGNSRLAKKANNHFGIKCHLSWDGPTFYQDDDAKNECFRKYRNAEKSFKDHSTFLTTRSRYSFLFELPITDYKGWANGLKEAGYATNPKYPTLLINLINRHNLSQYDLSEKQLLAQNSINPKQHKSEKDKPVKPHHEKTTDSKYVLVDSPPPIFDVNDHPSTFNSIRTVYVKNQVKCTVARKDDSFMKIANDLDMLAWQIYKYNDLDKADRIKPGQLIYLKPKRKNYYKQGYHLVQKGESLHSISQSYGVKLKSLINFNGLSASEKLFIGQKIKLNKRSEI